MTTLERPGAVVNYEVWGEAGGWVTLVNGHTRPLNDFRMLGKFLVEQGHRVLALDNRGAGQTTVSGEFKLADMAGDVVALWDHLGIAKGKLLGISMGGFIAQTLALDHAARVEKLALVSTAMNQKSIRIDERPWSKDLAQTEAKLSPYFTRAFAERNAVLVKSMAKQIAKAVDEGRFGENSEQQKRAVAGFDAAPRVRGGGIRAKAVVIHGDQDEIIPVSAAQETHQALLQGGMRHAALELFKDAGHLLLAERPKELYQVVGRWFA